MTVDLRFFKIVSQESVTGWHLMYTELSVIRGLCGSSELSVVRIWFRCIWYNGYLSRDMTKQSDCAPSEDSDRLGHPPSLIRVFAVRSTGSWGHKLSSCGQRRLWSDAQAVLFLRLAHNHFVSFVSFWHQSQEGYRVAFGACSFKSLQGNGCHLTQDSLEVTVTLWWHLMHGVTKLL